MRKLIVWNLISLDGFFEGAQPWELDWHEYVWGDELERLSLEQLDSADLLLFGRATYEGMAAYWSAATGAVAELMNGIAKRVYSRTLKRADWSNTTLVPDDAAADVARLKQAGDANVLIFGSARLTASLARRDLVDEYRLGLVPVVLGRGTPLFPAAAARQRMELVEATPLRSGCVILRYRPLARADAPAPV
jgi:dihydrofolate reductase